MSKKRKATYLSEDEDRRIMEAASYDPDNRLWTSEDFEQSRSASEAAPHIVERARKLRGEQKAPTKMAVSVRLDRDVIAALKADGPGWQTRMNSTLRRALKLKAAG